MRDDNVLSADEDLRAIPAGDGPAEESDAETGPDDTCQIEHEGQVYEPAAGALKGAFLRQADYTRKTQELAAHRRALSVAREAAGPWRNRRRPVGPGGAQDRLQLAALEPAAAEPAARVDWRTLSQRGLRGRKALWFQFQRDGGGDAASAWPMRLGAPRADAGAGLQAAREAAAQMAETGRTLSQEIEGWSPEVAAKLVDYAKAFGVTHEELAQMADPRLWKVLHKAYQADCAARDEGAASAAAKAQAIRPAVTVSGAAAGSGGVRDELATKEWMARRNEQMRKGR